MARTLAMILAGGAGTRLFPLTQTRTKPAVPFAGGLRLVDFVLNNFINSDLLHIYVLTQFKSQSLNTHLRQAWHISGVTGHFIDPIPAQMRMGKRWYEGTADAIYQNIRLIELHEPEEVCIFGSDHIYKMDIRQVLHYHRKTKAKLTVCGIRVPIAEASRFGVIEVDENYQMIGFEEKPANPIPLPSDPTQALVSMGNYVFQSDTLFEALNADSAESASTHDFGRDIIPKLFPTGGVQVYDFNLNQIPNEDNSYYWRDVGTLASYWQAHMDLLSNQPTFELFNPKWPLRSYHPPVPSTQVVADSQGNQSRLLNSIVASGCRIQGAQIDHSVLGYKVLVGSQSLVKDSLVLGNCRIGPNCHIQKCIIDKDVEIAPNSQIGLDSASDRAQGFTVTDEGIVVVPKGMKVGV